MLHHSQSPKALSGSMSSRAKALRLVKTNRRKKIRYNLSRRRNSKTCLSCSSIDSRPAVAVIRRAYCYEGFLLPEIYVCRRARELGRPAQGEQQAGKGFYPSPRLGANGIRRWPARARTAGWLGGGAIALEVWVLFSARDRAPRSSRGFAEEVPAERAVFTRSPGFFGIIDGATTTQS